jgi:hypothetical protein
MLDIRLRYFGLHVAKVCRHDESLQGGYLHAGFHAPRLCLHVSFHELQRLFYRLMVRSGLFISIDHLQPVI